MLWFRVLSLCIILTFSIKCLWCRYALSGFCLTQMRLFYSGLVKGQHSLERLMAIEHICMTKERAGKW